MHIVIAGAGEFGITAALALHARGHAVTVLDPGPLPHPLAASTDTSKVVRMDYADPFYVELGIASLAGWRVWNEGWDRPLYHETGIWMVATETGPDRFETVARRLVAERGATVGDVTPERAAAEMTPLAVDRYAHGYTNAEGGWAESGEVIARLVDRARGEGVTVRDGVAVAGLDEGEGRITGLRLADGSTVTADRTVLAAGAWTPLLAPHLADRLRATGQPICWYRPADPDAWRPPRFRVWTADVIEKGWYGFPALPDGRVKVANHGVGRVLDADAPRVVTDAEIEHSRAFLREAFPALADAPLTDTRLCLYCDTPDGDFLVGADPDRPGLVVASGGSGHAFKFAPVLGAVVADAVEGIDTPATRRFAFRAGDFTAVERR